MRQRQMRLTKADLAAARDGRVADVIAPGLKLLFVGINPGLYSAAVGHHFARPGNRFWAALHAAGIIPRLLRPDEERLLLEFGCGVTNVVNRATARAGELSPDELIAGGRRLAQKVRRFRIGTVAFLGATAYRTAFDRPRARIGLERDHRLADRPVWVLPNPSGLNAHYHLPELAELFRALRNAIWPPGSPAPRHQ